MDPALVREVSTSDAKRSVFVDCIERLQRLIERESEAVKSNAAVDFEDYNARKTHALLEFTRASRAYSPPWSPAIEARMALLRVALVENNELLERRLRAMKEIAGIVIFAIEMAESDGTYSTPGSKRR